MIANMCVSENTHNQSMPISLFLDSFIAQSSHLIAIKDVASQVPKPMHQASASIAPMSSAIGLRMGG